MEWAVGRFHLAFVCFFWRMFVCTGSAYNDLVTSFASTVNLEEAIVFGLPQGGRRIFFSHLFNDPFFSRFCNGSIVVGKSNLFTCGSGAATQV